MYLAQLSTFQTQASFYINILENIIKGNQASVNKENIDIAICEAVDVAKGHKNIFAIDNNHYFFITTLLSKYSTELKTIEGKNIQPKIYTDILSILE